MSPDSDFTWRDLRAPPGLPTAGAGGWLRNGERGGAARRVSCVLWTLETLARSWLGQTAPMARAVGAGTRLPRREVARAAGLLARRGLCRVVRGRVVRRRAGVGAACRVSCAGRALETLFLLAALAGVWARSGKKGGRAGGRGPLYACRGTKKIFSVKEILFINEKKFFSGRGKDEESPPPLGRRAEGSGGIRTRGVRRYRPAGRPP